MVRDQWSVLSKDTGHGHNKDVRTNSERKKEITMQRLMVLLVVAVLLGGNGWAAEELTVEEMIVCVGPAGRDVAFLLELSQIGMQVTQIHNDELKDLQARMLVMEDRVTGDLVVYGNLSQSTGETMINHINGGTADWSGPISAEAITSDVTAEYIYGYGADGLTFRDWHGRRTMHIDAENGTITVPRRLDVGAITLDGIDLLERLAALEAELGLLRGPGAGGRNRRGLRRRGQGLRDSGQWPGVSGQ